jgi:hypothetical protein
MITVADQRAHREAGTQAGIAEYRQVDQGRSCSRLDAHEEAGSNGGRQEQSDIERTEMATRHGHGQRIGRKGQGEQHGTRVVEGGAFGRRRPRDPRADSDARANHPARPSGRLTRKSAGQPQAAISAPPRLGPSAVPIADIVPSSPMARPVLALGTTSATRARLSAIISAAPRPCAARAATSQPSVGARPQSSEAAVYKAMPASSSRRRPNRSPSRPTPTIRVVIGQQVGEHDPLHVLEGGVEGLRQGRQADVGDAGAERGEQHGQGQAGQRPEHRRTAFRAAGDQPRCV